MKIQLPAALSDWRIAPINDIFDINAESLPASTPGDFEFDYLPLECVGKERIDWSVVERFKFGEAPSRARRRIEDGDLLISTVRPNLQGFAEFRGVGDGPFIASTGFLVLRRRGGGDARFHLAQLLSDFGAAQFHAHVTGTNYPAISDRDFSRIQLLVPNCCDEEGAISIALTLIGDLITATQEGLETALRLQRGTMRELLTGRMRADGSLRVDQDFWFHGRLGAVPLGWKVGTVREACEVLDHLRRPVKKEDRAAMRGVYPYYGACGIVDYVSSYLFDGTFILFGEDGENLVSRKLPQAFLVNGKFWVNNHAHILTTKNPHNITFICAQLQAGDYRPFVYGSAQPKMNKTDLLRIRLLLPPAEEQCRIAEQLSAVESLIAAKQSKIAALQRLKKSLMQNLLTGRLRLSPEAIAALTADSKEKKSGDA